MRPRELAFVLPPDGRASALKRLAAEFHGRRRAPVNESWRWLDTFDWRVHRSGGRLELSGERAPFDLVWRNEERSSRSRVEDLPAFAHELPNGGLRAGLSPLVEPRRLLVRAEVERRRESVDLLDPEGKTVCRVHAFEDRVRVPEGAWSTVDPVLVVEGIRGYDTQRDAVELFVHQELGLRLLDGERDGVRASLGDDAGRDPSSIAIQLDPEMPAFRTLQLALGALLRVLRANEEGIRRDLDPEFLHDFRVALRRTRSVLSEVKRVFPEAVEAHYKREFRWLAEETGSVRDLDVLLDFMSRWKEEADLAPLFAHFTLRRREAHLRLVAELESKRYSDLVHNWGEVLNTQVQPKMPRQDAERPILHVVSPRVRRRLKRVLRAGQKLSADAPAADLHKLRIQAKKLRYLLEIFGSLYPVEALGPVLFRLKRLQDTLGEIHDAQVHARTLADAGDELSQAGVPARTLLGVGRILSELERREKKKRRRFEQRFRTLEKSAAPLALLLTPKEDAERESSPLP